VKKELDKLDLDPKDVDNIMVVVSNAVKNKQNGILAGSNRRTTRANELVKRNFLEK
jgi:hypothetical protein